MMRQGIFVIFCVLAAVLAGCAVAPNPEPSTAPPHPASPNPMAVPPTALPLSCADILSESDLASLGPAILPRVDEDHLEATLGTILRRQNEGALYCGWSDTVGRGGWSVISGEGFNGSTVVLSVAPTTDTALDPAAGDGLLATPADHPTLVGHCDETYSYCDAVQLRAGYRVHLILSSTAPLASDLRALALGLIEMVGSRIDDAGPTRLVAPPVTSANPTASCHDEIVIGVLTARGYAAEPTEIDSALTSYLPTCRWASPETYGSWASVTILPGGAWAPAHLAVPAIGAYFARQAAGQPGVVAGCAQGSCIALLPNGDDLIEISVPEIDGDPEPWAATVAEVVARG